MSETLGVGGSLVFLLMETQRKMGYYYHIANGAGFLLSLNLDAVVDRSTKIPQTCKEVGPPFPKKLLPYHSHRFESLEVCSVTYCS